MTNQQTKKPFNPKEQTEKSRSLEKALEKIQAEHKLFDYRERKAKGKALQNAGPLAGILDRKQEYMNALAGVFMHTVTGDSSFYNEHGDDLDRVYELWDILYKLPQRIREEFVTDNDFMQ